MTAICHHRRRTLAMLGAWLAAGRALPGADASAGSALRAELERAYANWLGAMRRHDRAGLESFTSRYRLMCLRNEVVSWRQPWPAAVFRGIIRAPDTGRLTLLDAAANGPTARLVYFGRVDFQLGDVVTPENPLVLRFLRDDAQWKFDWLQYVNLGPDDETRREIRTGGRRWLEAGEFKLSGRYPDIPKRCRDPYLVASLAVIARGCRVTIDINRGMHVETIDNNRGGRVVTGGLQKGANAVVISPQLKARTGVNPRLEIALLTRTGDARRPVKTFWSWKPDSVPWRERYEASIFVKSSVVK